MLLTSYSSIHPPPLPPLLLYSADGRSFPPTSPMAVRARYCNPFILRPVPNSGLGVGVTTFCNTTVDSIAISVQRMPPPDGMFPSHHQCCLWSPPGLVKPGVAKAESGFISDVQKPGKRSREGDDECEEETSTVPAILDGDIRFQIHQQQLEIDCLLSQHAENVRLEIMERQRWSPELFMAAVEEVMGRELGEKEEEMERLRKINCALQERVRCLHVENHAWRDMARTNEAAMNTLRNSLEQVLEEQLSVAADDCMSSSDVAPGKRVKVAEDTEEEKEAAAAGYGGGGDGEERTQVGMCRFCGERASTVLLLPCRHLCLCDLCGSTARRCPVCRRNMNVSVHVNLC